MSRRAPAEGRLDVVFVGVLPPHPGGSAITSALLLSGIARSGHTVRALVPVAEQTRGLSQAFAARNPDIRFTFFPVPYHNVTAESPPPADYRAKQRRSVRRGLRGILDERRPDVVIIGRETFASCVVPLVKEARLPCVLRVSGSLADAVVRGAYPKRLQSGVTSAFRRADVVVVQAEHMAAALRSLGAANIHTIPNLVDLKRFRPGPKNPEVLRRLGCSEDDIIVLHPSNLKDGKRPLDVVDSAKESLKSEPKLMYVVAGDGPLRGEMERHCRNARILSRFRFTGWLDYDQMPDYMRSADMVVVPSAHEQQARVYVETMACGRLLLASNISAARELVDDGKSGLLYPVGDWRALAERTLAAAGSRAMRIRVGRGARLRASAHDAALILPRFLSLLAATAARSNHPGRYPAGADERT